MSLKRILSIAGLLTTASFALDDVPLYLDVGGDSAGIPGSAASADNSVTLPTLGGSKVIPLTHSGALDGSDAIVVKIPPGTLYWNYGIKIPTDRPQPIKGYKDVHFWAKNNSSSAAVLNVKWQWSNYGMGDEKELSIPSGSKWQEVVIPLSDLGPTDTSIAALYLSQAASKPALDLLIDSVTITDGTANHSLALPAQALESRPTNWPNHFVIGGLDKTEIGKATKTFQAGSDYRYQYIMPETIGYWSPSEPHKAQYVYDYAKESDTLGVKSAFVWYNLGKTGEGYSAVTANLALKSYMDDYVMRYDWMLTQMVQAGQKDYIIVLEPDMYGFLMRGPGGANGLPVEDPTTIPVNMDSANKISGGHYASNFKGWAEFMIAYARTKLAKNGVIIGHMPNHWGVNIPGQVGRGRIEAHLISGMTIARFINNLGDAGKGDVIFTEKTDYDAGTKGAQWFWDSTCYSKYFTWTKAIASGTKLPICGWQVSEGNSTHTNASEKDDAVKTFLSHPDWWVNGGFIGILFGGGNGGCANYSGTDDGGWYTTNISAYNANPYILPSTVSGIATKASAHQGLTAVVRDHQLVLSGWNGLAQVRLFDVYGRRLASSSLAAGGSLSLGNFHGTLFAVVENAQGRMTSSFSIVP